MHRDGDRLHTAWILIPIGIDLREDHSQCHTLSRAYIFYCYIKLKDSSQGFQIGVPCVYHDRILAAFHRQVDWDRTWLRIYYNAAVYRHSRAGNVTALPSLSEYVMD